MNSVLINYFKANNMAADSVRYTVLKGCNLILKSLAKVSLWKPVNATDVPWFILDSSLDNKSLFQTEGLVTGLKKTILVILL